MNYCKLTFDYIIETFKFDTLPLYVAARRLRTHCTRARTHTHAIEAYLDLSMYVLERADGRVSGLFQYVKQSLWNHK